MRNGMVMMVLIAGASGTASASTAITYKCFSPTAKTPYTIAVNGEYKRAVLHEVWDAAYGCSGIHFKAKDDAESFISPYQNQRETIYLALDRVRDGSCSGASKIGHIYLDQNLMNGKSSGKLVEVIKYNGNVEEFHYTCEL